MLLAKLAKVLPFVRAPPPPPPPLPWYVTALDVVPLDVDVTVLLKAIGASLAVLLIVGWLVESIARGTVSLGKGWSARAQTIAVASFSLYSLLPLMLLSIAAVVLSLSYSRFTSAPMVVYLVWAYGLDKSATSGARRPWLRFTRWWQYYADFFPITLIKTADLDPSKTFVFGYHPHGIISVGAMGAFAFDGARTIDASESPGGSTRGAARGFSSLFPGLDPRLVTLPLNFMTPLLRELILSVGCVNSAAATFRSVLRRGPGTVLVVVVGGAEESLMVIERGIHLIVER